MTQLALITGASVGIGRGIAFAAARNGFDLILNARSEDALEKLAEELRTTYGVRVDCIAANLSTSVGCRVLIDAVASRDIDVLVNNAGRGVYGPFVETDIDDVLNMMRLNMDAPTMITHALMPGLVARNGRILNIASIAGFMPGPYFANYHATKAYLRIWSEGIAEELQRKGVSVTTYCPGPTHTNFEAAADASGSGIFKGGGVPSGEEVGADAWRACLAERGVVVHGLKNKLNVFAMRLLPRTWQAKAVKAVTRRRK